VSADVVFKLVKAGMSEDRAQAKMQLFGRAEQALGADDHAEVRRWYVPGRIEVLGKHTDYAGGRSLLCTVERGICVVAKRRGDAVISARDVVSGQATSFELSGELAIPSEGWTVYPKTVARRIARNFSVPLAGADIVFGSDLPRAAGMSSSSAMVVTMFLALAAVNQLEQREEYRAHIRTPEDLAGYLGCIENGQTYGSLAGDRGVGTFGGSEDHTAMLCAQPGRLVQYSFCPVRFEHAVKVPSGCVFVIAVSGVAADKTGSAREKYNRASQSAQAVLEAWRSASGTGQTLAAVVASSPDAAEKIRSVLRTPAVADFDSTVLLQRFEQFLLESETIVPQASDAVARGDLEQFGKLVAESQTAAEELLGNQVPETITLVRVARSLGAHAASAFGAGFGGSVWAMVESVQAEAFVSKWRAEYGARFPQHAECSQFFTSAAGPPLVPL